MDLWEAVELRTGMDEAEFRSMNEERGSLLAFWLEGEVGPYCVRGVDWEYAGGIDDVIDLVRQIIKIAASGGTFDPPADLQEAFGQVMDLTADRTAEVREDCDLEVSEKLSAQQIHEMIEDDVLYPALGPFLRALVDKVDTVALEENEDYNHHSSWTLAYLWADDELKAKAEIRSLIGRIRSIVDAARVDP